MPCVLGNYYFSRGSIGLSCSLMAFLVIAKLLQVCNNVPEKKITSSADVAEIADRTAYGALIK